MTMFHHIVMFRFKEEVTKETVAEIRTQLLDLPSSIETIRSYHIGRDAGVTQGTWDLVVIAEFDDEAGYRTYRDHPDHVPVVNRIASLAEERASVQTLELG
jgi:hypothetical protein